MDKLYIDATVPLRWGPHPPVGIPRVETAIVRQALRRKGRDVRFFMINRAGAARFLTRKELTYLEDLVEGRLRSIEAAGTERLPARLRLVMKAIRSGAATSGKEFDRVAAGYLSGRNDRRGGAYQLAKTFVRLVKLGRMRPALAAKAGPDPLAEADAHCFLSTAGLHGLAAGGRTAPVQAHLSTVLHDLIPIDRPDLVDGSHARNFSRDVDWMFEHCERILCVSGDTAKQAGNYATRTGLDRTPEIAVARLGSFLRAGLGTAAGEPVESLRDKRFAIYCSTIEIRKNHLLLLKAWTRLIPVLGDRLPVLALCGRWGWMNEAVEAYLASHPELEGRVVFLSDVSDAQLAWLYRSAEFGLYPSLAEGWGLGAAECLDFGLPVLLSDTPSLAEATQGLMPILPANDLDGWVEAIRRAATDGAFLAELRERIRTRYVPVTETAFSTRVLSLVAGESQLPAPMPQPRWRLRLPAWRDGLSAMAGEVIGDDPLSEKRHLSDAA